MAWIDNSDGDNHIVCFPIGKLFTHISPVVCYLTLPKPSSIIQDELEEVVEYAQKYLAVDTESYRKVWYKLHTCPDASKWPNVLELVFSLPFTTSHVEQMFSFVKTVKTKLRTNLLTSTLNDLLEISIEGPPLSSFNASAAVNLWWTDTSSTRRVKLKLLEKNTDREQLSMTQRMMWRKTRTV